VCAAELHPSSTFESVHFPVGLNTLPEMVHFYFGNRSSSHFCAFSNLFDALWINNANSCMEGSFVNQFMDTVFEYHVICNDLNTQTTIIVLHMCTL
jgi:hypothetical protein